MTPRQSLLNNYPPTHAFAVVTWGAAATSWLAHTLNTHPDIFCLHAGSSFMTAFGDASFEDDATYLEMVACQGYAHKLAGDVHGIGRDSLPALRQKFGEKFGAAIVVRDPLPRLRSQLALFARLNYSVWGPLDYVDVIAERGGLDPTLLTVEQRHFLHGANMLNAIVLEQEAAPIFRSEDLTSDPESLLALVAELSGGKLRPDMDWAVSAIGTPKVNQHVAKSPVSQLDEWTKDALKFAVAPEAWSSYESLGYPKPDWL